MSDTEDRLAGLEVLVRALVPIVHNLDPHAVDASIVEIRAEADRDLPGAACAVRLLEMIPIKHK